MRSITKSDPAVDIETTTYCYILHCFITKVCFSAKKPSLGLSWSNCVTTRILVSCTQYLMPPLEVKGNHYTGGCGQGQSEGQVAVAAVPLRRLDVVMSPFCARRSCFFVVDQSGIQAVQ